MANMKTLTVNGVSYTVDDPDAVSYGGKQTLTESQKQQALENIGAVSYDGKQTLTDDQQAQARENIGAVDLDEVIYELAGNVTSEKLILSNRKNLFYVSMKILDKGYGNVVSFRNEATSYDVILRGIGDGEEDTDVVNKRQLDSAVKEVVDRTCPAFTQRGAAVICEPVEGYPMTVTAAEEATKITRCGKNLLLFTSNSTTTSNGVTFTGNGDGTITVNGTATADATRTILNADLGIPFSEEMGVGFSGTPKGGSASTYLMENLYNGVLDVGNGAWIPGTTTTAAHKLHWCKHLQIKIKKGYTAENLVFKPCLYIGKNAGYEPCVKETFAVGDAIPALDGINTIWADTGEVTVTGRANPSVIIDKLTNAIQSLGGNV